MTGGTEQADAMAELYGQKNPRPEETADEEALEEEQRRNQDQADR